MIAPNLNLQQPANIKIAGFETLLESKQITPPVPVKPAFTGRHFIFAHQDDSGFSTVKNTLQTKAGMRVAHSRDFQNAIQEEDYADADVFVFDDLGIALAGPADNEKMDYLGTGSTEFIIEPEAVTQLPRLIESATTQPATYGLNLTNIVNSQYTGTGVKVAVLDTGFDLNHPDFVNRNIQTSSFVPNQSVHDRHGHGTHCIGTACGDTDHQGTRYGIAKDCDIYVGKVLNNSGSGAQAWSISAINWAVQEKCKVISMSLGSYVYPGTSYSRAYELAAQNALRNGCFIVAAAGNDSRRTYGIYEPVNSPANAPSILGIGAIDINIQIAPFSNRSINPDGQVDFAAPGVAVYSSWDTQKSRYRTISGTSMATPHVAGLAALYWDKNPNASAYQIITEIFSSAKRLLLPSVDCGAGLPIAP